MPIDRIDELLDGLIELARPRRQLETQLLQDAAESAFAEFEAIHQHYVQSFRTYRVLLSGGNADLRSVISRIREECLFTEHQRAKLRQLSGLLSVQNAKYVRCSRFFAAVHSYLTTSHDIDHVTYPPDYFAEHGQRWFHGLVDALVALDALCGNGGGSESLPQISLEIAQEALDGFSDPRRGATYIIDQYASQLQVEFENVCAEYSQFRHAFLMETTDQAIGIDRGETYMTTILFLAADPSDATRLRLGEESREIQEKLRLAISRDLFTFDQRWSVRPQDLTQALIDVRPRIVHFAGHGTSTGALCLEDQLGRVRPVNSDDLAALFELVADQVECVVLNACYSEMQAKAIAIHIPYVIGMRRAIGDKAAIAFAVGFYQALGGGRSIEDAYKFGCVQIRLQGIPEHLTPVLIKAKGQAE